MTGALTTNEDLWIHANAVVAHPYSELPFTKGDFSLDMPGVCVLVCVANRLANDPINVITEDGNQLAIQNRFRRRIIVASLGRVLWPIETRSSRRPPRL